MFVMMFIGILFLYLNLSVCLKQLLRRPKKARREEKVSEETCSDFLNSYCFQIYFYLANFFINDA
jgi:hypothetical protein